MSCPVLTSGSNPLLCMYCIRLHKIIVMLRCEESQCDDMCAGLGQCATSHTSINYFKSLLQKKAFCSSKGRRREMQRRQDCLSVFCITNARRVKSTSINALYKHGETRFFRRNLRHGCSIHVFLLISFCNFRFTAVAD